MNVCSAGYNSICRTDVGEIVQKTIRLRFGVSDNFPKGRQVDFVLVCLDKDKLPKLPALIARAIEMIKSFVPIGSELKMRRYNK